MLVTEAALWQMVDPLLFSAEQLKQVCFYNSLLLLPLTSNLSLRQLSESDRDLEWVVLTLQCEAVARAFRVVGEPPTLLLDCYQSHVGGHSAYCTVMWQSVATPSKAEARDPECIFSPKFNFRPALSVLLEGLSPLRKLPPFPSEPMSGNITTPWTSAL